MSTQKVTRCEVYITNVNGIGMNFTFKTQSKAIQFAKLSMLSSHGYIVELIATIHYFFDNDKKELY